MPSAFPSITTTVPLKYSVLPPDYKAITTVREYEDGGASFNTRSNSAPQRWILEYNGLTASQLSTLDAHYASAGLNQSFNFVDRAGTTQTNVYYESYEKDHVKSWVNSVRITLIKRPA